MLARVCRVWCGARGLRALWISEASRLVVAEGQQGTATVELAPDSDVPYSPRGVRAELGSRYGAYNVASTTVPPSSGKNVRLAGQAHPDTGIVFDSRGFPIFGDVAASIRGCRVGLSGRQAIRARCDWRARICGAPSSAARFRHPVSHQSSCSRSVGAPRGSTTTHGTTIRTLGACNWFRGSSTAGRGMWVVQL